MDTKDYIKALSNPNITNRKIALNSGYVPKNIEEVNITVEEVMLGGNSELQRIAFNLLAERVPFELARSGYIALALKSHREKVRLDAVNKIRDDKSSEVTKALLIAAYDDEIDVQKAALSALEGRKSPEILPLLIARIEKPDSSILSTYASRSDEIKRAAINSLGAKKQNKLIPDLIEIAVNEPEYRPEAKASLERIGTTEVTEQLLSVVGGTYTFDEDGDALEVNKEVKLFIANIIPSVETTKSQAESYRLFLCNLYKEEIVAGKTDLSKYVCQYFNEDLGSCLSEVIKLHPSEPDVVARVIHDLASVPISSSFPNWLNILNNPEEPVSQLAVQKLIEILTEELDNFPKLLSSSFNQGDSPAHKKTRLVQIVVNLSSDHIKSFSDVIVPSIRDSESQASELAKRYLQSMWQQAAVENREIMLESMFRNGYLKRKDGREAIGKFFTDTWDSGNNESHERIYRKLVDKRFRATSEKTKDAYDDLLCYLANKVSTPSSFAQFVITDLGKVPKANKLWEPLARILGRSPTEESGKLLVESLNHSWKKPLLELAITLEVPGIESFCRSALQKTDYELPEKDEVWVIQTLSEYENPIDAELFAGYITSENPVTVQVASIHSLSRLPINNAITRSLVRSLKIPIVQVVTEAIIALGNSAIPTVDVISALQERASPSEEDVVSIRKIAKNTLEILTAKHLVSVVDKESDDETFDTWLEALRQIGVCECHLILDDLFKKHADPEHANRRISIVQTITSSTKPDDGIKILEKYIVNERVAPVKDAMKAALDVLEGHPDRADFTLLEKVIGQDINRNDLLGKWHLNDVFSEQRTIVAFREGLRRALDIHKNDDALVEQLDAISDALIRDLFDADKQNLDPDGKIPEDAHNNRIGKLNSHYPEIALPANAIHKLRKLKVKGPHSFDPSGAVRPGVDSSDRKHAIESFCVLFKEIIKTLRKIKESQEAGQNIKGI